MSELRAAAVSNLAGTGPTTLTGQTAAKAWIKFNGTGTVAIGGSANISSLTDNGAADYTPNFTVAMTDVHYARVGMSTTVSNGQVVVTNSSFVGTVNGCRINTQAPGVGQADSPEVSMVFVR